jgi:hypothetical protein
MNSPAMERFLNREEARYRLLREEASGFDAMADRFVWDLEQGNELPVDRIAQGKDQRTVVQLRNLKPGRISLHLTVRAESESELAQMPLYVYVEEKPAGSICLTGARREATEYRMDLGVHNRDRLNLSFFFKQNGLVLEKAAVIGINQDV